MNHYLTKKDDVKLGYKGNWIVANGRNAELIAFGAFAMFVMIGIAALAKANR